MKKDYIAPQLIEELAIEIGQILAGSGEFTTSDEHVTVTPGEGEYGGGDWASRRSIWADESDGEDF